MNPYATNNVPRLKTPRIPPGTHLSIFTHKNHHSVCDAPLLLVCRSKPAIRIKMMLAPKSDAQTVGTYHNTQSIVLLSLTDEKLGAISIAHVQTIKTPTRMQGGQCCNGLLL